MGHIHSKQRTSKANDKTNDVKERNEELNNKIFFQKNVSDTNAKGEDNTNVSWSGEMEEEVFSVKSKLKVKSCKSDDITQKSNSNENGVSFQATKNMTAERSRHLSKSSVGQSGDFVDLELAKSSVTPYLVLGDETVKEEKHSNTETTKMVCTFEKYRKEDLLKCSDLQSEANSENLKIMSKCIENDEKFVDIRRQRTKNEVKKTKKQIISCYKEHILTYFKIFWLLTVALQNSNILQAIRAKAAFRDQAVCAFNMSNTDNVLRHLFPEGEIPIELSCSKSVAWKKLQDTVLNHTHFQRIREDVLSFPVVFDVDFENEWSSDQIRSILSNEILRRVHLKSEAFRLATFDLFDQEFEPGKTIRLAFKGFYCDLDGRIRCYQCSREYNGTHLEGQAAHCQNSTEHRRNSIAESYGRRSTGYLLGHSQADEIPFIDLHNRSLATSWHERQMFRHLFSPEAELLLSRTVTSVPNDDSWGYHIQTYLNSVLRRPRQPEECHQGICRCYGHVAVRDDRMNEMLLLSRQQTNDRASHLLRYQQQIERHNPNSSAVNDYPTRLLRYQSLAQRRQYYPIFPYNTLTSRNFKTQKRTNGQPFSDIDEFQSEPETVRSDENNDDDERFDSRNPTIMIRFRVHIYPQMENDHNDHVHQTFVNVVPEESPMSHYDGQQLYSERTSERTSELPGETNAADYSFLTATSPVSILQVETTSTEENIQQGHEHSRLDSMERLASVSIGDAAEHEESTRRSDENKTDWATQKK